MSKSRWEEILEEYEVGNPPDITHDAVGMAQRIAELEYKLNTWLNEILSTPELWINCIHPTDLLTLIP